MLKDDRKSPLGESFPLLNPITVTYSSPTVTATPDFHSQVSTGNLISVES